MHRHAQHALLNTLFCTRVLGVAGTHSNCPHPSLPTFSHYMCCYDTAQLIDGDACSPSRFPGEIYHTPSPHFPHLHENSSSISSSPEWVRSFGDACAEMCEKAFGFKD